MVSYANTNRMLGRRSLVSASKVAGDAVKAEGGTKGVAASAVDDSDASIAVLTLDDFGGRSDALGG
jgi:hypothetical protein